MTSSTIYSNESNPHTLKLVLAATFFGKKFEIETIPDKNVKHQHFPYVSLNDENLFMPNAVLLHIQSPNDDLKLEMLEWLEWESSVFSPCVSSLFGNNTKSKQLEVKLHDCLRKLDQALKSREFLIESQLTICDICFWALLFPLIKDDQLAKEFMGGFGNVSKWFESLENRSFTSEALKKYPVKTGYAAYQVLFSSSKYLNQYQSESTVAVNSPVEEEHIAVSGEEIEMAEKFWNEHEATSRLSHIKSNGKSVPKENQKNILITSALPYVNNVPHLGNIIGCVLSADVFARFSRLCGHNVLYICGTDEYGTATETKALEEGLSCEEICSKYFKIHESIYKWFNISFDHFGRTSTPEQTELAQDIFLQLNENGFMFTESVDQLHCAKCDRFLADRFVEGTCPNLNCSYEDARGDQCDSCGKLVNATELKNPRCKMCKNAPTIKSSTQFFMDLPKLEPLLLHWFKKTSSGWTNNAQTIAKAWLKDGLKPRCITRDLKWGVPVPINGYRDKVFYVWFDAPIGYMSITKRYSKEWEKWWKPSEKTPVTLYNFMAKDNVPFHSIMFPATLLGCNRGFLTVSHIVATEYLNYEEGKFSKSRGYGVFGTDAAETQIPSDVWRFYLLYVRPESQDSSFNWLDLSMKTNSELLSNVGNFINRALMFVKNSFNRIVPKMTPNSDDLNFLASINRELKNYTNLLQSFKLRDGLRSILCISKLGNQYMQLNTPWVLLKGTETEKQRAGTVVGILCNVACLISIVLSPYMPETSEKIRKQLNVREFAIDLEHFGVCRFLKEGHVIGEPSPLFRKIEDAEIEELRAKFRGKTDVSKSNEKIETDGTLNKEDLDAKIAEQASKVRKLKESGSDKSIWQPEVEKLLSLKSKLALLTGEPIKQTGKGKKTKK